MSTKRKRVTETEPEKDVPSTSVAKKRKGRMTLVEKERREAEMKKGEYVMSKIRRQRNSTGTASCVENFLRLPSRRLEPEYYEKVKEPIDITSIQQKLKIPDYSTYDQFCDDVTTLISNNLSYYKEDSEEYRDIQKMDEVFKVAKGKVESGEYLEDEDEEEVEEEPMEEESSEPVSSSSSRESTPMELDEFMLCDLLGAVLEATDNTGRLLCPPFRALQSREEFPSYYEKITNPIDLKTIAQNGKEKKYSTMKELKDDLFLLFKNAQQFSGKGTDIYKDAEQLKTVVREKIAKIEEKGVHPMRKAKALRLVDALLTSGPTEDFSEDSEEDEETESNSDPVWKLYWTIRNATDEKDRKITLADNFLELPSKESYPDYYDEIKVPVSLFMINKRLKNGKYDVKSLVSDLIQMYTNAFEYNLESSDVYIAAQKLKTLTISTAKQLAPSLDLSLFEPAVAPAHSSPAKPKAHRQRVKIELDTDSESGTPPPSNKRKSPKKPRQENGSVVRKGRPPLHAQENNDYMKHKHVMQGLWNCIYQFRIEGNPAYWPAGAFMDLPSMKQYPEYYQIIQMPIDMKIIRNKIDSNQYPHAEAMVADCRLMFSNARDFNEPSSNIHIDAIQLEKALLRAYEGMRYSTFNQAPSIPSMPSTPSSSSSNLMTQARMKLKTPKSETRGRKKKYAGTGTDDEDIPRSAQKQQKNMESAIMQLPPEEQKMWRLFKAMKDVREEGSNRMLAVNFMRLPTKDELPSYYEVIKKPMDMMRIKQKLDNKQYVTLLDVVSDFMLMLSNACKFNETDSDIYKEAVSLQKALLEMKRELDSGEDAPRVQVELRTIFTSMFASLFSKKDEEGKCYSDHLTEITEVLKSNGVPAAEWPYTLDQIKMNIDKCRYRRLDKLQKDFFDLFERTRELSRVDSPMYNAACVLQKAFIVERDARCKDLISSNAYSSIEKDIDEAIHYERTKRAKEETDEESGIKAANVRRNESEVDVQDVVVEGVKYTAPCYAYISRSDEKKMPLHIFRIERIFRNENGEQALQGHWVYRPEETLHLASRKFMKQEAFITPFRDTLLADRLRGLCVVVSLATFTTKVLTNFSEEDVYMCEYKYHGKPKYFSKLRAWPYIEEDEELECTKRTKTLTPKRNLKASNDEVEVEEDKEVAEGTEDDEDEDDRARCEVALDIDRYEMESASANADAEPGRTYFQQIRSETGKFYWLGQFVLVFNPRKPLCDVMRINKIWREEDGTEWFSGCWFARPVETIHDQGRLFFKNEVIAVYRNDEVRKLSEIQRICDVMPAKLYVKQRQTEISECDVFVCETVVNGSADAPEDCSLMGYANGDDFASAQPMNLDYAKTMRKMKTYKLHSSIPNEESLFYKTPIKMDKELSPLLKGEGAMPLDHLDEMMEDDTDGSESVSSTNPPTGKLPKEEPAPLPPQTPSAVPSTPSSAQPLVAGDVPIMTPRAVKSKSGYILFSAEVRKRIMHENPDAGFGEVSKIVGIEWKKLSEEQKKHYEMRAEVVATEKAKLDAIKASQAMTLLPGQIRIYQCKWAACDSQYDTESGLLEHVIQHHTSQIIMDSDQQYVCMWMTCLRNRKDGKPFPSLPRLHRHIKEKHMPNAAKNLYPTQLGKNFFKAVNNGDQSGIQVVAPSFGRLAVQSNGPQQHNHVGQSNGMNGHSASQAMPNGMPIGQQMHHQHQQMPQQHPHGDQQQQAPHFQQGSQPHPQMQMSQPNGMYQQGPSSSQQFHQAPSQMAQQQAPPPQQQMQQVVVSDVGRTVVRAVVPAFVAPPNQIHSRRVLHSEAYLKYIESLAQNRQKSVSRWERSLGSTHRTTQPNGQQRLPAHWIRRAENGRPVAREEDVTKALWKLRDELLKSTCSLVMDRPSQ